MWNVITKDNKNYPTTPRLVVGCFIGCDEPFVVLCRYDVVSNQWYDSDNCLINIPDYWAETPENEEKK